ncbi:hypothetical protein JCM8097_007141 [Rhodosporidiobolus ruineniae]
MRTTLQFALSLLNVLAVLPHLGTQTLVLAAPQQAPAPDSSSSGGDLLQLALGANAAHFVVPGNGAPAIPIEEDLPSSSPSLSGSTAFVDPLIHPGGMKRMNKVGRRYGERYRAQLGLGSEGNKRATATTTTGGRRRRGKKGPRRMGARGGVGMFGYEENEGEVLE